MLKKYLFCFLILTSTMLSQDFINKNSKIVNDFFIKNYTLSLKHFKNKEYEKAYILLNELFKKKTDDLNINFYLGRSAYETKRYHEAISSYERFLFEEPDNNRVKLEMARSLFMTNTYKESQKLLLEVKNDPKMPKATLTVVNYYLKLIKQKEQKHFLNGVAIVGINYDSNINTRSKYDIYDNVYISSFNTYVDGLKNTVENEQAWYNQEIALINYKYKINDNTNIKQDFMIFNKDSFQSKYNSTDVVLLSYTPAINIQHTTKLSVDYALYTDLLWYGGEKTLKTFALFPKFNYEYNKSNSFSGYLKYQNKFKQKEEDKSKNSTYTEFSTTHSHIFNKKLSLRSTLTFMKEKKRNFKETGIDYTGGKGSLALSYKYKPNFIFTPSVTYMVSKYDDLYNHDNSEKQKNKKTKVAFSSTYVYSPKWIIQSSIDYTKQNSNDITKEYKKHSFTLNLIRPF